MADGWTYRSHQDCHNLVFLSCFIYSKICFLHTVFCVYYTHTVCGTNNAECEAMPVRPFTSFNSTSSAEFVGQKISDAKYEHK